MSIFGQVRSDDEHMKQLFNGAVPSEPKQNPWVSLDSQTPVASLISLLISCTLGHFVSSDLVWPREFETIYYGFLILFFQFSENKKKMGGDLWPERESKDVVFTR